MNSEKYIGLDVHQATIVVAVTDSTGKLVEASQKGGGPQGQSSRPTNANLVVDPWVTLLFLKLRSFRNRIWLQP